MGARQLRHYEVLPDVQVYEPQAPIYPKPRNRAEFEAIARPKARVREASKVSPSAIVGFLLVGVLAVLMLIKNVELLTIQEETVQLQNQLAQLESDEKTLLAQYSMAYDLQEIEETLISQGIMQKPMFGQTVVLDMSEPDNVVVYEKENREEKWYSWILDLFQ